MDYSFENAQVEIEKNFTKDEQVKMAVKSVAEVLIKKKEDKEDA